MKTVSVVIPVYYNERSLTPLFEALDRVKETLEGRGMGLEVICVDDGSGDRSFAVLGTLQEKRSYLKLVKLTRNFGSMCAFKAGLQYVTGDCFTLLSADLQDDPTLILEMTAHWQQGHQFVICERESRDDPFGSKVFASLFYTLFRRLAIPRYPEGGFDLFLLDRRYLAHIQRSEKNTNLLVLGYWLGVKPVVIKYQRRKREHGTSRWTFAKKTKLFIDTFISFSFAPIRFISLMGILTSILSFLYGLFVVLFTLLAENPVPGWTTIVALITFLLGLIMLMLGIIGEYLWRILDEGRNRPEYVIEEVRGIPSPER
ncbi:MAG: glycosyltransferase family 2 protein [Nitrospirota bacterium]